MKKLIKNHFAVEQRFIIVVMCVVLVGGILSCSRDKKDECTLFLAGDVFSCLQDKDESPFSWTIKGIPGKINILHYCPPCGYVICGFCIEGGSNICYCITPRKIRPKANLTADGLATVYMSDVDFPITYYYRVLIGEELIDEGFPKFFIIIDKETGIANLYMFIGGGEVDYGEICNFPKEVIKRWNIEDGSEVYFEVLYFEACLGHGGISTMAKFDFLLTSFKKKIYE